MGSLFVEDVHLRRVWWGECLVLEALLNGRYPLVQTWKVPDRFEWKNTVSGVWVCQDSMFEIVVCKDSDRGFEVIFDAFSANADFEHATRMTGYRTPEEAMAAAEKEAREAISGIMQAIERYNAGH